MKKLNLKSVVKTAGAGALALAVAVPMFAQSQYDQRRGNDDNNRNRGDYSRSHRENERVTAQGRITTFSRERDGYRVQLDQGRDSYWVPESYFRNRGNDLRVGVSLSLGGIFRGGSIYVDSVNWPDQRGERGFGERGVNEQFIRGRVERVDYRNGNVWVREEGTRRSVTIDLRNDNASRRFRRGDYVQVTGRFQRNGIFDAYRINEIR